MNLQYVLIDTVSYFQLQSDRINIPDYLKPTVSSSGTEEQVTELTMQIDVRDVLFKDMGGKRAVRDLKFSAA